MAIAEIRSQIEGLHKKLQQKEGRGGARDMANKRFLTKITVNGPQFATTMTDAINKQGIKNNFGPTTANHLDVKLATWSTCADWSNGKFGGTDIKTHGGVKCDITATGALITRESPHSKPTTFLVSPAS